MSVIFISYERTLVDQVELDATFSCPKCGSDKWLLNTVETKASVLLGNTRMVKAVVVCKGCEKRIAKKYQSSSIRDLAASKEKEFKPSFLKRFGFIILLLVLFTGIMSYAIIDTVVDHNRVVKNAQENFAKAYGQDAKKVWLENIQPGDFILCNKDYYDPARVFQVKEVKEDILILTEFEQSVPRSEFEDVDKLNQLVLGTGDSRDIEIRRKDFNRNIIELDGDSRNNLMIQQIRKK
ncbi:hypothetical protein CLV62_101134 [Dysgonomonas alginatilytica]|uniref:Uncharacterized protein n=1 Tax=Dysgonomonas alginatilytica TaxID=1605892 RepID=A0A2V3PTG7_9BACT|nr:hypothetical protein [Dysgonomonas alginatilytica]PXV68869.1 hypothetical protein CLV62_101134 [Dysgonomonas alginatilytica]